MPESEQLDFRASSYTNGGNGCVEPAPHRGGVTVRDSKDPHGPRIEFTRRQWALFLHEVANDLPCRNGAVTVSTEVMDLVYDGKPRRTCWNLRTVDGSVVQRYTAPEKQAFLLGVADGEFDYPETEATTEVLAAS